MITVTVNGEDYEREVEPRMLLADFLRHELGLTGTHVGCEHGVCGACTVILNGDSVRSCLCLAIQVDGAVIEMQPPAIGQQRNLRAAGHSPVPTGQGLSSFQASTRMLLPCPGNLSSPTMALTWPPSAA